LRVERNRDYSEGTLQAEKIHNFWNKQIKIKYIIYSEFDNVIYLIYTTNKSNPFHKKLPVGRKL